jgi:hypothetical protein
MSKRGRKKSFDPKLLQWFERDFVDFLLALRDGRSKRRIHVEEFRPASARRLKRPDDIRWLDSYGLTQRTDEYYEQTGNKSLGDLEQRMMYRAATPKRPELWNKLNQPLTGEQVQRLAALKEFRSPLRGCVLPSLLYDYPTELSRARNHALYPHNDDKRIDFLARWFAGIAVGIPGARAVEHLRKIKHGRKCECWRCERRRQ